MPDLYGHLTPQGVLNGSLQTIVFADNYNDLINKPSINSVELQGNKTAADLGLLTAGDIPVESVNGKQGVVILDGDDIEYEAGTSVNSKITDLEAEIGSGPVISVNGQQGVVELDGTDINYSLTKTLNQKIDEVAASIPVVSYPVTSVNTKTGDVVLDGDDIDYAEGVTVNDQIGTNTADIGTNAAAIGSLSSLTTTDKSSLVGAVNEIARYTPVYGNTASGAIATFDTSLALPLQDCTIAINAVQESETPTPSSPKLISGVTGANVTRCGKNIYQSGSVTEEFNGSFWSLGGTVYSNVPDGSLVLNAGTYTLSNFPTKEIRRYDETGARAGTSTGTMTFTLTKREKVRFVIVTESKNYNVHIEVGDTATTYEAYNGDTYTFEFGQTVYGGLLDVTTGVLTVTHSIVDLGSLTQWNKNTSFTNTLFVANVSGKKANNSNCLCTNYTNGGIATGGTFLNNMQNNNFASDASNGIYIRDDSKASLSGDDFKTAMSGVYLVYELATPVTYQLTPKQISAIVGTNNVFTDTNGDTSVVYACSLKDYIDSQ